MYIHIGVSQISDNNIHCNERKKTCKDRLRILFRKHHMDHRHHNYSHRNIDADGVTDIREKTCLYPYRYQWPCNSKKPQHHVQITIDPGPLIDQKLFVFFCRTILHVFIVFFMQIPETFNLSIISHNF